MSNANAQPQRQLTGREAAQRVKEALAEAGMPRTSRMNGGEMTGWTRDYGSTGFSLRLGQGKRDMWKVAAGQVDWHVVVSGKPLLDYREYEEEHEDGDSETYHEPIKPERLFGRIREVFESLGLKVHLVRDAGHQTLWDDDVNYNVVTDMPDWLSRSNG